MQIMSNVKGASAALPAANQVGSANRVSKPRGRAAGGGKKKQSGPYVGMTNKQIRGRKARERVERAVDERLAEAGTAAPAANADEPAADENMDGGDGTALLENQQEGPDVNLDGRDQTSMNLESVPSSNTERQARSRRRSESLGASEDYPNVFDEPEVNIPPEPVRENGREREEYGNQPYRHPHYYRRQG